MMRAQVKDRRIQKTQRALREALTSLIGEAERNDHIDAEADADSDSDGAAIERSLSVFDQLFDLLLSTERSSRNIMVAFDLTHYVCGRLVPEAARVKTWLERLIKGLLKLGILPDRRDDVAASILLLAGVGPEPRRYRWARDCLLRMDVDFAADVPSTNRIQGFQAVLPQSVTLDELWMRLRQIRTYPEQARAYLSALKNHKPTAEYGELAKEAIEEWPILETAFESELSRKRILELSRWQESCPRCQISLPTSEVFKLQSLCCRRVIVWTGD